LFEVNRGFDVRYILRDELFESLLIDGLSNSASHDGKSRAKWKQLQGYRAGSVLNGQSLYGSSHNLFTVDVYESGDYDKNKNAMKLL
jgi:hypothetical protein